MPVIALALLLAGALCCSLALAQSGCTNPSPLPSGYAAPCPVFSVSPASLSQSQSLALTATPQAGTDYIYTTAYYAQGSTWIATTLTGNNAAPSYSSGPATGSLPSSVLTSLPLGTNYIVLWDWLWDANARCYKGPGLNQCNTGIWRLQTFSLTQSTSGAQVSISPTTLTFPSTQVGTTSAPLTFTVTNIGNATLTMTNSFSGDFTFGGVGSCTSSLAAGASCTYSVDFIPTAVGTRTGQEIIADNAPGSPHTESLTGTGVSFSPTPTPSPAGCATGCNTYYVSPTGSDSNPGTQASPWKTIGHADGHMVIGSAGTIVHVAAGTYNTSLTCAGSGDNSILCINQGGSSLTARLVYQCDTPATLAMRGTSQGCYLQLTPNSAFGVFQIPISLYGSPGNANNVDIVGFHIAPNADAFSGIGINCNQGSLPAGSQCLTANSVHIIGNLVESGASARAAICSNSGSDVGAGIIAGARHSYWVSDSQVIGNMVMPWGAPNCYRGYDMYLNSKDQIAYNNLLFGGAIGIHVYDQGCGERISNNVIVNPWDYGIIAWNTADFPGESAICTPMGLNTIDNNIIVNAGVGFTPRFADSGSGIQLHNECDSAHPTLISNNLMFGNTHANIIGYNGAAPDTCASVVNTKSEATTSTFVNFQNNGTGDYHLKASSLAINGGTIQCVSGGPSSCTPTTDFSGVSRPQGSAIDIGAYEQ